MGIARNRFSMRRCFMPGVEAVEADTSHSFPRHVHEQHGIGVMMRGAQRSASGRGPVEAGAGDMITVNPGEVHDGVPLDGEARRWTMLYFDPALMGRSVADLSEDRSGTFEFTQPVISDRPPADLFRSLFAAMTEDLPATGMRREETLLMLLERIRCERVDRSAPAAAVALARAMIDDDPAAPLALADLARESGLSRFQLVRGFARTLGLTPHAYLMQRRVHLARRLVASGVSLAEAAVASGFADQSHMTRQFSRVYGISPGAYAAAVA
ncbi:AraC family transcriptional regulator [Labrys miyagiensis]